MTTTDRLRALLAEATPGPWDVDDIHPDHCAQSPWGHKTVTFGPGSVALALMSPEDQPTAALIVAAVNALPALLDVVEAARSLTGDDMAYRGSTSQTWAALRAALAKLDLAAHG